jgi:transposase
MRRKEVETSMRAYSQDVREHVLRTVDLGHPRAEIVQFFGISLATLKRYIKQRREEGHVRPKAIPGRPPKTRAQVEAGVLPQLQANSDATLEQHCDLWEQTHGERVSRWTMSRAIKRLGWTRKKKSLGATERNEEERATWRANASTLPTEALVVIDECGSNIALTPLYARAPKGERARGSVPRNRGKNTTLIAALSLQGMGAALILEGSANTTAFEVYVEQLLAPSLHAGQIVIMDNLQAHKSARVRIAIEAKGCQLLFLPSYSPDLSPIEEAFSKLKTALRRAGARTREALEEAIGQALLTITAQDAQGWFQHCGYLPAQERKS